MSNPTSKQSDVEFHWHEFVKTFIYEFLGILSVPLIIIICIDGKNAAMNRAMLPGVVPARFFITLMTFVCGHCKYTVYCIT